MRYVVVYPSMSFSPEGELQMDIGATVVDVVAWVTGIVTIASIIVALTPTPKDDEMLGKLYKILELFALTIGKAKQTGKEE